MAKKTKKVPKPLGRPRLGEEVVRSRSIGLPQAMWDEMKETAHRLRISVNELARRRLEAGARWLEANEQSPATSVDAEPETRP